MTDPLILSKWKSLIILIRSKVVPQILKESYEYNILIILLLKKRMDNSALRGFNFIAFLVNHNLNCSQGPPQKNRFTRIITELTPVS